MRFALPERTGLVLSVAFSIGIGLPALAANPERDAYFGETHVHTSWSLDAFAIGNTLTTPGDAYKYFKGEPIKHPLGYDVKIDTPLDWAGVTDHSEYAGVVNLANEPGSAVSKLPAAQPLILKARTKEEMERVALYAINTLAPRTARQGADVPRDRRRRSGSGTSRSPTRRTSRGSSRRSAPTSGPRCRTT